MATSSGSGYDSWVLSVDELLAKNGATDNSRRGQECSVYRVPPYLRTLKPQRYDWITLPLGLYNRDFKNMTAMDRLKLEVVGVFLKLAQNGWDAFRNRVATPAQVLENFYHDPATDSSPITPGQVQSLLTIDAVFVAAYYYHQHFIGWSEKERDFRRLPFDLELGNIFSRGSVRPHILSSEWDIPWILENQIPLFMIRNVFDHERINLVLEMNSTAFLREIVFSCILPPSGLPYPERSSETANISFEFCDHLLACLHAVCVDMDAEKGAISPSLLSHFPSSDGRRKSLPTFKSLPTASELRKTGVRFEGVRRTSVCDIKFVKSIFNLKATLYLPQIEVHDHSQKWLLNMCVYEWMNTGIKRKKLIAYMQLMDDLISTEEDVHLLRKGAQPVIARNSLGEDKLVADAFNNALENITIHTEDFEHLSVVIDQIHAFYGTRWRHQLTHFIDRFLIAPWILVTMVVATLILVATLLQTVYTMLSFY